MKKEQLDPPRWKDGPQICKHVNLPAFKLLKDGKAFMEKISPNGNVKMLGKFKCPACGGFHLITTGPDPGGGSSGTGRSSKLDDKQVKAIRRDFLRKYFPK